MGLSLPEQARERFTAMVFAQRILGSIRTWKISRSQKAMKMATSKKSKPRINQAARYRLQKYQDTAESVPRWAKPGSQQ